MLMEQVSMQQNWVVAKHASPQREDVPIERIAEIHDAIDADSPSGFRLRLSVSTGGLPGQANNREHASHHEPHQAEQDHAWQKAGDNARENECIG